MDDEASRKMIDIFKNWWIKEGTAYGWNLDMALIDFKNVMTNIKGEKMFAGAIVIFRVLEPVMYVSCALFLVVFGISLLSILSFIALLVSRLGNISLKRLLIALNERASEKRKEITRAFYIESGDSLVERVDFEGIASDVRDEILRNRRARD